MTGVHVFERGITPDLSEFEPEFRPLAEVAATGTTQFWGDPPTKRSREYSLGYLCPLCGIEGAATPITNDAKLCMQHRFIVKRKTALDLLRFKRYAAKHSERWRAYLERTDQ